MRYKLKRTFEKSLLYSKNDVAIDVNGEFEKVTGYTKEEIIGKSLAEVSKLLRMNSQTTLENIQDAFEGYIFTKEYEPREVTVSCQSLEPDNEKVYFFKEKLNSRIGDRLPYAASLMSDNEIGVSVCSINDGLILKVNEKFLEFIGIPKNKIGNQAGKTLEKISTEYKVTNYEEMFLKVAVTGKAFHSKEVKSMNTEREEIYWSITVFPIYILGKVKYIVYNVYDITEKVLYRKVLEEKNKELEAVIENMSDGLFVVNKEGIYIAANKLARNIFQISSETHSIKDVYNQIKAFDSNGNLISCEDFPSSKIMRGEKVFAQRFTVEQKDKSVYIELNGTPIYDKEGNFVSGVACIRDITEQVNKDELIKIQKDELIKMQENELEAIIENIYDCLLVFNKDGNIIKSSKTIENYIKKHSEIVTINDYFKHIEICDLEGNALSEENSLVTRIVDGEKILGYKFAAKVCNTVFYFELNGNPIYDSRGNFVAGVILSRDITDEIKYKNKMEEALKIQDEVFANISHELKTPLNIIYSTNQLIDWYLKNGSFEVNVGKISNGLKVIKQNCYRFSKLIDNIVDLSKIESGFLKLNPVNENIVSVIEDIVESVSKYINGKGIDIVFDTNTEEKIIACDHEKIERIILNLISNAIKFTNSEGSISIELIDKGEIIEIVIKDTGIGIDKKHLNNIFKRFYQTDKSLTRSAEGSGIGLALVKSLVELHDGKISIESMVAEGSIFKIELPSRTIKDDEAVADKVIVKDNNFERVKVEFSDIYLM